jgi:hypothetical protein
MAAVPRQNRVDPWGNVIADPARGAWLGNRGCIHDELGNIRRTHALKRWIYCLLDFKGRKRELMQPGKYTELFFLDEPTALSAGHRPCAECQRARFEEFRSLWPAAAGLDGPLRADAIDDVLHRERIGEGGRKVTFHARLEDLPDGVMLSGGGEPPLLLWRGALHSWTPSGYAGNRSAGASDRVEVLTPPTVVEVLANGFSVQPALKSL